MNKKDVFYNVPISSQCYIVKLRKSHDINFNKIIPKKGRIFITKTYTYKKKDKDNYNNKIMSLPYLSKCFFIKNKKIINVRTVIALQNVINNKYFCTKEIINRLDNRKKVYIRKLKSKKKTDTINNNLDDEQSSYEQENNEQKNNEKIEKSDNDSIELDIGKHNNSPNIIIKIINPLNSSYKYSKINIKTKSPNNIYKSKSCHKIIYNDNNEKKRAQKKEPYLINIIKDNKKNIFRMSNKKKIKKIKNLNNNHNNRYENKKRSAEFKCLKNKEIVSALNNSSKYKLKCPACMTLNKKQQFGDKIYRNLRLKDKNMSKSGKNFKIKSLKADFNFNNSIKNRLLMPKKEEDNIQSKKIQKYNNIIDKDIKNHLFPQSNKIINDKRNNNLKQKNNISSNSMKKNSKCTHIEFPVIDSYFH